MIWHPRRLEDFRRVQRLRFAGNVLLLAGLILLISPAGWIAYTALAVAPAQTTALAAWDARLSPAAAAASSAAPAARRAAPVAGPGSPEMVLTIPRLGLRRAVPPGADVHTLRRYGVGHISWTALPDGVGIVGIAGHRTTYGAPFLRLNLLRPGDLIQVDYRGRRFSYAVTRSEVVTPDRVDILEGSGQGGIALVACTPVYSAAYRLVVLGAPTSVTPTP